MRQILLQNTTATLLQNATKVYYKMRRVFCYKMRQFYYKMRQLLKIVIILLQNTTVITKCDVYYKLRQYDHTKLISMVDKTMIYVIIAGEADIRELI